MSKPTLKAKPASTAAEHYFKLVLQFPLRPLRNKAGSQPSSTSKCFYNRKRLHGSIDYHSPEAFEAGLN